MAWESTGTGGRSAQQQAASFLQPPPSAKQSCQLSCRGPCCPQRGCLLRCQALGCPSCHPSPHARVAWGQAGVPPLSSLPPRGSLQGTYVACELMHCAILGHVVFLVWVILRIKQSSAPRHSCPQWHQLLAGERKDAPRTQRLMGYSPAVWPVSHPFPGWAGVPEGGRAGTLMLSAKSSSAFAPTVSMELMRLGSLFLVLAAVP